MTSPIKLLWLCGVPHEVQQNALAGRDIGAFASWSWVMGHLPPPEGVELHIACPAKNIQESFQIEYRGAVFHFFPARRGAVYLLYRPWLPGFRRVFNAVRPDWVHGWGVEAGFGCAALSLSADHSVVEIQGILANYFPYLKKALPLLPAMLNERLSLRRGPRFIAESEYSAVQAKQYTQGQVGVVNQPLRDSFLEMDIGKKSKQQVLFLGSMDDRKGIKDAVRAFAESGVDGWELLCVGRGSPDYEAEIHQLIDQAGVGKRIRLLGTLDSAEIINLFQESPVFLLPTYMDTGPNALKEAMAMGLWPLCYDNSGPKELITRYRYGSLSPTGDIPALMEVLRNTLAEQPWTQPGKTDRCVQQVRHDLSRETAWKELMKCYSKEYWADDQ